MNSTSGRQPTSTQNSAFTTFYFCIVHATQENGFLILTSWLRYLLHCLGNCSKLVYSYVWCRGKIIQINRTSRVGETCEFLVLFCACANKFTFGSDSSTKNIRHQKIEWWTSRDSQHPKQLDVMTSFHSTLSEKFVCCVQNLFLDFLFDRWRSQSSLDLCVSSRTYSRCMQISWMLFGYNNFYYSLEQESEFRSRKW